MATYYLSKTSTERLGTCHKDLQKIFREVIKYTDFSVTCGFRGEEEQDEAFSIGASKKKWPNSKHNEYPSMGVDIAPYPIDWLDIERFYYLAGIVFTIAQQMEISIIWGGNWKNFKDYPHYQLRARR